MAFASFCLSQWTLQIDLKGTPFSKADVRTTLSHMFGARSLKNGGQGQLLTAWEKQEIFSRNLGHFKKQGWKSSASIWNKMISLKDDRN